MNWNLSQKKYILVSFLLKIDFVINFPLVMRFVRNDHSATFHEPHQM